MFVVIKIWPHSSTVRYNGFLNTVFSAPEFRDDCRCRSLDSRCFSCTVTKVNLKGKSFFQNHGFFVIANVICYFYRNKRDCVCKKNEAKSMVLFLPLGCTRAVFYSTAGNKMVALVLFVFYFFTNRSTQLTSAVLPLFRPFKDPPRSESRCFFLYFHTSWIIP